MQEISLPRLSKWISFVTVLLLYSIVFNPWIKFPYTFIIISLLVIMYCLWQDGNLDSIGFQRNGNALKIVGIAILLFISAEILMDLLIQPLVNKLTSEKPDYSTFNRVRHQPAKFSRYLVYIWISAAFGEEIFFRGFLFRQMNLLFEEWKRKNFIISMLSSILFALPHFYLGASGLVITFLFGLLFSWAYVRFHYNLWILILFHGLIDSLFLTLAYVDKLSYYEFANKLFWGF